MKIKARVETKDEKGNAVDLNSSSSKVFDLVPPGRYVAIVRNVKSATYTAKGHTLLKLTPKIELVNDNKTLITRQDFVVGAVDSEGNLYHMDGDTNKPLIWTGAKGAAYLLLAVGLLKQTSPGVYEIDGDPDKIFDRGIMVKTDHEEYKVNDVARKKNIVTQIFPLTADQANEAGFVVDEFGRVFANEVAAAAADNEDQSPDF